MTNTATVPSALDFPALDGRPVTQAHANLCAVAGHAVHSVDGVDSGVCPRCGVVSPLPGTAPRPLSATEAVDVLVLLRRLVRRGFVPLVDLNTIPRERAAARVLFERGLLEFSGGDAVPSDAAAVVLRSSEVAAARWLVDLPVVGFQD